MPELPEVEAARRRIERYCVGAKIVSLNTREQGGGTRDGLFDERVYEDFGGPDDSERQFRSAMLGKTLKCVHRRGKQLWFEFDMAESLCVLFHFGMNGSFALKNHQAAKYKGSEKEPEQWPPRFTKIMIEFSNGELLTFSDMRRIGKIRLCKDPFESPQIQALGIDPILDDLPDCATLQQMLSQIAVPIKTLLLDQERLFCGIGNYLADEILYQARIHPLCAANLLTTARINALVTAVRHVTNAAVEAKTNFEEFPADWLYHQRWDKVKSSKQQVLMPDGNKVVFETIAGHTTAIVPKVQLRSGPLVMTKTALANKKSTELPGRSASPLPKATRKSTEQTKSIEEVTTKGRNKRSIASSSEAAERAEDEGTGTRKSARLRK